MVPIKNIVGVCMSKTDSYCAIRKIIIEILFSMVISDFENHHYKIILC